MNIQSYIANISVSKSLEEIITLFENTGDITALDSLFVKNAFVEWTAPKWIKNDDIVFFMFSVTSKQTIRHLLKEFSKNNEKFSLNEQNIINQSLDKSEKMYKKYGGSIFAIGRVKGQILSNNYSTENKMHWKSQIYAPISDIHILENPILYSDFKSIVEVSKQSSITGIFGEEFSQLKEMIISKNDVPNFIKRSKSSLIPLSKIDSTNWLLYAYEYRRNFFLETQFRSYYTNYFLKELSDIRTIYKECSCIKNGHRTFVDNVILVNGFYLAVEIKLTINAEKNLISQCGQYCNLDKMILDFKINKECNINKLIPNQVLIIDTDAIYFYFDDIKSIKKLFDLDKLQKINQINDLKTIIVQNII